MTCTRDVAEAKLGWGSYDGATLIKKSARYYDLILAEKVNLDAHLIVQIKDGGPMSFKLDCVK